MPPSSSAVLKSLCRVSRVVFQLRRHLDMSPLADCLVPIVHHPCLLAIHLTINNKESLLQVHDGGA